MILKSFELNKIDLNKNKIILMYGKNEGLKNEYLNLILKNSKNISNLDEKEVLENSISFLESALSKSLFENEKIIIIKRATDKILKIIEDYLDDNTQSKMILFSDNLEKRSKLRNLFEKSEKYNCVACYPDNDVTLRNIILNKLKNFQGLDRENINSILNTSSIDRYKLLNEIEKINSFFSNKKITHNIIIANKSKNNKFVMRYT